MGIVDDLKSAFGDDFFEPKGTPATRHHWEELCVCGHLDRYHSPSIGGAYRVPEPHTEKAAGEDWTVTTEFDGCVGAVKSRGADEVKRRVDREKLARVDTILTTCPCTEFRAVATVDRPNRYFNQRLVANREDPMRHPFMTGMRAFRTHLSKRKAAQTDPAWADAEFERRFTWLDGARVCGMSTCSKTDGVWPAFVSDDGRSELRCEKHR